MRALLKSCQRIEAEEYTCIIVDFFNRWLIEGRWAAPMEPSTGTRQDSGDDLQV
jgi:hypothetical protein